jgi:16S rRNA processing protein RimM
LNTENPSWIRLAHILRPRGNKGEVAAILLTDFPERFSQLKEIYVGHTEPVESDKKLHRGEEAAGISVSNEPRAIGLKAFWASQNHPGQGVFHFEGVDSITEAEKFRGLDILLPFAQRIALPAGKYFVSDLVGCSVFERPADVFVLASSPCSLASAPAFIGAVRDVQLLPPGLAGTPLLEVETSQGELLIPLAEDICVRIDTVARRIEVVLPEGLRELNDDPSPRV